MAQGSTTAGAGAAQGPYPGGVTQALTITRASIGLGFGTVDMDDRRYALNALIVRSALFNAVMAFDAATLDRLPGDLGPESLLSSTDIGASDKITLNRPGYRALGNAVELRLLASVIVKPRPRPRRVVKPDEPPATPIPGTSG